jgi:hypothetical protein
MTLFVQAIYLPTPFSGTRVQQLKKPVQVPSCKMRPLTKDERIRKETALEALRDALRPAGRLIRPRPGNPGYDAVRVAMLHWHPEFDDLSEKERKALLRSATKWLNLRNSKPGPHASVDVERHASLRRELVELLEASEAALTAEALRSRQRRLSPNKADDDDEEKKKKRRRDAGDDEADDEDDEPAAGPACRRAAPRRGVHWRRAVGRPPDALCESSRRPPAAPG